MPPIKATGAMMSYALRLVRGRPRLMLSVLVGVAAAFVMSAAAMPGRVAAVAAWDLGTALYLVLSWTMMVRSTPARMRRRAATQDESRWVILTIMVAASFFSLLAIGVVLRGAHDMKGGAFALHVGLAAVTLILSWMLLHTLFALHYAHGDYAGGGAGSDAPAGLAFPGGEPPDYWDFLYFSFVVGMTCQVSDVGIASRELRRLALIHGILSFFFNTVVLALSINIAAGLL